MNIDFDKTGGLVPVVVQDHLNDEVLMLAYMNEEALQETLKTGKMHYYSRSRDKLWMKGEQSGHTQEVKQILVDCDTDTLLCKVQQNGGAACHEGYRTCFYRRIDENGQLESLGQTRQFDPAKVYGK